MCSVLLVPCRCACCVLLRALQHGAHAILDVTLQLLVLLMVSTGGGVSWGILHKGSQSQGSQSRPCAAARLGGFNIDTSAREWCSVLPAGVLQGSRNKRWARVLSVSLGCGRLQKALRSPNS